MPPKKRGRKAATKRTRAKKAKDPLAEKRKLKLDALLLEFDKNVNDHVTAMTDNLRSTCSSIQLLYNMELYTIPEKYRSMTKKQYEDSKKTCAVSKPLDAGVTQPVDLSSVISRFESCRATTAKKKQKFKKVRTSSSKIQRNVLKNCVNTSTASIRTTRRALAQMQETVTPVARQQVFQQNFTPKVKKSSMFPTPGVVTPKFDPRKPLISSLLRRPKAGEIVMSMSGSPLQVPVVEVPPKPGIMLSFGGGRVLNIGDASGLNELEKNLDQSTKLTLRRMNETLSKVLAS